MLSPIRTGMSLVEVMVVILLLGMGLGAAFSSMGSANATRTRTDDRNKALASVQSQIEIFQALDQNALDRQFASADSIPFAVAGLIPGVDPAIGLPRPAAGTVTRISRVSGASVRTCLHFSVVWQDAAGTDRIEMFFHHAPRL